MHQLKAIQKIPAPIDKVWELFSNPDMLRIITPPGLNFRVLSEKQGDSVFAGQIIEYKVSPLFGIPLFWRTEIVGVKHREFFIDEQRKGPYSIWHHEHYFKEIEGGVEMTDLVRYKNPFGIIGRIVNNLVVRKKLRGIFEFRFRKVEELFGKWEGQKPEIIFY